MRAKERRSGLHYNHRLHHRHDQEDNCGVDNFDHSQEEDFHDVGFVYARAKEEESGSERVRIAERVCFSFRDALRSDG